MLICPDHPTFLRTKTHSHGFVPFARCGTGIPAEGPGRYDETAAASTGLVYQPGHLLMRDFLAAEL